MNFNIAKMVYWMARTSVRNRVQRKSFLQLAIGAS